MRGYTGKFYDVNLTKGTINDFKFSEKDLQHYLGGRSLSTKLLWDRLGNNWDKVDPLGPENIITFFTGL